MPPMASDASNPLTTQTRDGFLVGESQTLVCLGDSITQNSVGYCSMLAALIAASYPERSIKVVNAGIGGNKIGDMLARVERDVLKHKPDWVTVNVGINDVWHGLGPNGKGTSLANYKTGLAQLLDILLGAGAQVVLLPPTVIEENLASVGNLVLMDYRAAMRAIANEKNLRVAPTDIDIDAALKSSNPQGRGTTLTTDGVHMAPAGDAVMACAVLKALQFWTR